MSDLVLKTLMEVTPVGDQRITVQNVNVPGYKTTVDAAKYMAMCEALMKVLPTSPPGMTQVEMIHEVVPHLPPGQFAGGSKVSWWLKTVQLDQEAKGTIVREISKPLRWYRK